MIRRIDTSVLKPAGGWPLTIEVEGQRYDIWGPAVIYTAENGDVLVVEND